MDVLNSNSTNAMKQNETKIDTDIETETEIENDEYDSDDESEITTNEKGFSRKIFSRIKELFKTVRSNKIIKRKIINNSISKKEMVQNQLDGFFGKLLHGLFWVCYVVE